MSDFTSDFLTALMAAPDDRKQAALLVLKGESAEKRRDGRISGRFDVESFVGLGGVAEFLGVSRRSVLRWRVPGHAFGSRTRYRLSEVSAYVGSETFRTRMAGLREERQNGTKGGVKEA